MTCPGCRQENPPDARFCNRCGARLEALCPACHRVNPPGSRFCNGCGHVLAGDLLKGYLQVADRDEPRAIREKVTGKLLALDRTLESALPAFLALLDVPVEDRRWEVLDPPRRRLRTLVITRLGVTAQRHLATAAAMYREMAMGSWLEKAEAEMRGLA